MWWWGRGSELRGPKAAAQESQTGFNSFDIPVVGYFEILDA
jgi:hypothetical protein